jgi:transposase
MLVQLFSTRHWCWRDLDSMVFPHYQRVFILEHYLSTRSYAECQNAFKNSFPDSAVTSKSTIQRLVERFRETASIGEKRRSGRHSVLSNDTLENIKARLLQSPRKSLRKFSQQIGMTYGSVQRTTKRLKLHPYQSFYPMCCVTFGSLCILHSLYSTEKQRNLRVNILFLWDHSYIILLQRNMPGPNHNLSLESYPQSLDLPTVFRVLPTVIRLLATVLTVLPTVFRVLPHSLEFYHIL